MGAECSCVCSQPLDGKTLEDVERTRKAKAEMPLIPGAANISIDSDESIILDPVEVLPKALIRRYLVKKYFKGVPLFRSFLSPGICVYAPPETDPDIEVIEKTLPPFNAKRAKGPTIENYPTVYLYEGGCYSGQWDISQQKPEGYGIMVYSDNTKYCGEFKSGKKCGRGRQINVEGDIYEGEFFNDKMQGQGKLKRSNGTIYKGGFINNLEDGEGSLEHMGKVIYQGSFTRGLKHGYGKLTINGNTYVGDFSTDQMDGNGTYTWIDGKSYTGGWKANKMHGYGTYKWADGKLYVGYFVDGIREGIGSFKWTDGREYKGGWSKGKMHGEGAYIYMDKGKRRNFVAIYEYGKRKKIVRY